MLLDHLDRSWDIGEAIKGEDDEVRYLTGYPCLSGRQGQCEGVAE